MTQHPHILIIGAGLIGIANARAFISRGAQVTLVEQKSAIGCGAGFANSGMIHPSQAWPWVQSGLCDKAQLAAAQSIAKLARHAAKQTKARMAALSLVGQAREPGCFQIFDNEAARAAALARYNLIHIKTEISQQFSRPALYFPDDFSGDAYQWCRAEINALIADGLTLHLGEKLSLIPDLVGFSVRLNGNIIKADHVIICAGHSVNTLLSPLNLSLPVIPIRGFALDFDAQGLDLSSLPKAPIMDAASRTALTRFDTTLRLSGTLGERSAAPLWQRWCRLIPDIMRRLPSPHQVWSGERPICALGRPVISQSPLKGLWVNGGHGHMGWTLALPSAALMARMILDGDAAHKFSWPK